MTFVQIIDYETEKRDEMNRLLDEWMKETEGRRVTTKAIMAHDRDNPKHYVDIIEFPSYEVAMKNSNMPQTDAFAKKMTALCSSGPKYINLDVEREQMANK